MMNFVGYFVALVLVVHQCASLESPCNKKNITLMSSTSFKPLVTPLTCGRAHLNESDVANPPNVILHGSGTLKNKYTIMLLMEKPNTHDVFSLKWLLSNISPLSDSLTANISRTEFLRYTSPKSNGTSKYWLLAFLQDPSGGLLPRGVTQDEIENFWPQKWISRNDKYIKNWVGGVEFYVNKPKNNRQYHNTSRYPVYPHNTQQPPRQYYTTPRYPVNPQQPPRWNNNTYYNHSGYPPNPGYPQQPPHYPQQPPHYPQQPPHYPQQPPYYPQPGYNPPPPQPGSNVHNHYYDHGKKGKKGGASAVAGFVPLIVVFALAAIY